MTTRATADWLSIHQASLSLGVHIDTVRQWSDAGLISCYRTAGGHRRFSRGDLQQFLERQRKSNPNTNPAERTLQHVRAELRVAPHADWFEGAMGSHNKPERARQREFGQRLLSCVVAFVEEPNAREHWLADGCRVARDYGAALAQGNLSAGNAARATIQFRQLVLKAVLDEHLGSRTGDEEDAHLFERVSAFLDEILFAILESYP